MTPMTKPPEMFTTKMPHGKPGHAADWTVPADEIAKQRPDGAAESDGEEDSDLHDSNRW